MTTFRPTLLPTEDPVIFDLEFDNTTLETFLTCGRSAERYVIYRRQSGAVRPALFYGGVCHKALEPRFRGDPDWRIQQQTIIVESFDKEPAPIGEWRDANCALECMVRYNRRWPYFEEPFEVMPGSVELPFRLLLGQAELNAELTIRDDSVPGHFVKVYVHKVNVYWTGRIDAIVKWDSTLMILDHKTGSMGGKTFYDDFLLSSAPHGYAWASRRLGYHIEGFVLDALLMRPPTAKGQTSEFERQRYWETYTDEFLDEWEQDTFDQLSDFLEHWARGRFSKGTKWCMGKFGACQYHSNCTLGKENRERNLFTSEFIDVTWSPLG